MTILCDAFYGAVRVGQYLIRDGAMWRITGVERELDRPAAAVGERAAGVFIESATTGGNYKLKRKQ